MKIRPLNEKVAVKFIEEESGEEKTESGIVLPDTAQKDEKPQQGEIIAIGDECEAPINIGDTVVFDKFAGSNINVDEDEFVILDIDDVLAVIE